MKLEMTAHSPVVIVPLAPQNGKFTGANVGVFPRLMTAPGAYPVPLAIRHDLGGPRLVRAQHTNARTLQLYQCLRGQTIAWQYLVILNRSS